MSDHVVFQIPDEVRIKWTLSPHTGSLFTWDMCKQRSALSVRCVSVTVVVGEQDSDPSPFLKPSS